MKIAIWAFENRTIGFFDPETANEKGLAGSEEAIVYCANILACEGHQVIVFGNPPPSSTFSHEKQNPRYLHHNSFPNRTFYDIVICW